MTSPAAGVSRIEFANIWERAKATHQAERVVKGKDGATAPDPEERYVLVDGQLAGATDTVPELSAIEVIINGATVPLLYVNGTAPNGPVWGVMDSGEGEQVFATEVRDANGTPIARITRSFKLGPTFDLEASPVRRKPDRSAARRAVVAVRPRRSAS